jgi:folate-binding protein YgfZ
MTTADTTQYELEALRTGAAIYSLTDRAFLRITGPDATRWLNGMVTNNIKDLQPGEGNYNFLLNAQGRIQADCTLYREYREPESGDPRYLLQSDTAQLATIRQLLDKFIIMDDVELSTSLDIYSATVEADTLTGFAITGHQAAAVFESVMAEVFEFLLIDAPKPGSLDWATYGGDRPGFVLTPPNELKTYEIWSSAPVDAIRHEFEKLGVGTLSPEAAEAHRILSGQPKFGVDITDKYLPQETAQTHALNFNKGCYLGQEIVERIHSRGQVHRTFTAFILTGDLPTLPAPLESNAKPAGELTSAIRIGETIYALGYARREFLETHAPLTYPNGTATPRTTNY